LISYHPQMNKWGDKKSDYYHQYTYHKPYNNGRAL